MASEGQVLTPDLCVIGGGAGGLAAAEAARGLGASVVLVERKRLGGSLLNTGALPAVALAAAAAQAEAVRTAPKFGIATEPPVPGFRRIHDSIEQALAPLRPDHAAARLEAIGVELVSGSATFTDHDTVVAGGTTIKARRYILATGSRPVLPDIPGLLAIPHFTVDTILDNTRKLTHLLVVGAGRSGLEIAQAYRRLGSDVTVVEAAMPLADADPELAEVLLRRLAEEGIAIGSGTTVAEIQPRAMGIGVVVRSAAGEARLDVSHVLIDAGRAPDLEGLGLEKAGIRTTPDDLRYLALNRSLRTTNARVFCIGDAAGGRSVEGARRQARLAVRAALLGLTADDARHGYPRVTNTDPAIAEVGLTEAMARARHGTRFRVERLGFAENDLARAERRTYGLAKLIVGPSGRILGAGVVGAGAGELAALFAVAIAGRMDVRALAAVDLPYPSRATLAGRLADSPGFGDTAPAWLRRWRALRQRLS